MSKLNLISNKNRTEWGINVKRSALEHGYQTTLYEQGNHNSVIGNYGVIAKKLYNNDRISESHYYTLLSDLGIDLSKLEELTDFE